MDRILEAMYREEEAPPLNPLRRLLWQQRRSTYDLTNGKLLPVHLGERSLARQEVS